MNECRETSNGQDWWLLIMCWPLLITSSFRSLWPNCSRSIYSYVKSCIKRLLIVLTVPKRNINIHQKLLLFLISHPTQKPQETGQDSTGSRCVTSQSTFQKRIYFSIITVFIVLMISPPVTVSVALSSFARTSTLWDYVDTFTLPLISQILWIIMWLISLENLQIFTKHTPRMVCTHVYTRTHIHTGAALKQGCASCL